MLDLSVPSVPSVPWVQGVQRVLGVQNVQRVHKVQGNGYAGQWVPERGPFAARLPSYRLNRALTCVKRG